MQILYCSLQRSVILKKIMCAPPICNCFLRACYCLLIVRYMLSDKIKGKSALKARTFLHVVRDKVHACYWYKRSIYLSTENSAGYLQRVQICYPSLAKLLPIRSIRSAMVINMDFLCQYIVTDIKQTCLGQGLGVTITARKCTSKLMFTMKDLGHTSDL